MKDLAGLGLELVSTGGSAAAIAAAGVPVRKVEDLTGFPEMLDGALPALPVTAFCWVCLEGQSHLCFPVRPPYLPYDSTVAICCAS